VSLRLPEHLLLFQIENGEVAGQVSEGEAEVGGGTGCEGA